MTVKLKDILTPEVKQEASSEMLNWQYEKLIGQLTLLQEHSIDLTCPCELSNEHEKCIPKHLITISSYCYETIPMSESSEVKEKLKQIAGAAEDLKREYLEAKNKNNEPPYNDMAEFARNARKEIEPYIFTYKGGEKSQGNGNHEVNLKNVLQKQFTIPYGSTCRDPRTGQFLSMEECGARRGELVLLGSRYRDFLKIAKRHDKNYGKEINQAMVETARGRSTLGGIEFGKTNECLPVDYHPREMVVGTTHLHPLSKSPNRLHWSMRDKYFRYHNIRRISGLSPADLKVLLNDAAKHPFRWNVWEIVLELFHTAELDFNREWMAGLLIMARIRGNASIRILAEFKPTVRAPPISIDMEDFKRAWFAVASHLEVPEAPEEASPTNLIEPVKTAPEEGLEKILETQAYLIYYVEEDRFPDIGFRHPIAIPYKT